MAGIKRSHDESDGGGIVASKRQKVQRRIKHTQPRPKDIEPAPQDPVFAQGQLLKSIAAALVVAGFDSVTASAMEMFRSHVEEYMLKLLSTTRLAMQKGRRTTPTPLDFTYALAQTPNTHTASLLHPQLTLPLPSTITHPIIPDPPPPVPPAPDFSSLLAPLTSAPRPAYVPAHFPALPPRHTWLSSAVWAGREKDARRMRERATEEGTLAEQALRKLAAAEKAGRIKREERVLDALEKRRAGSSGARGGRRVREDTLGDLLRDVGEV